MKKGPANRTVLDIPPAFRNDVLRNKQVIVGCGGGFHQECQQPYSPVASWMEDTDVALNHEGQQYGNLDEASAIARAPRKCLVIWCGDHKQTPGGLRKTDEAKAFRRKLWGWFRGTPFRSPLQGGLKGLGARGGGGRRSEGRRGLHLRKASRGLQGGFKGASRGLQGGFKGA